MRLAPQALWRHLSRGVRALRNSSDTDRDLRDELATYFDALVQSKIAAGATPNAARTAAQLEVGNMTAIREEVRSSFWEATVSSAFADVRYALRTLRRNRIFTLVVVGVIAIGIGAVTTIFSGVNAYLFTPLPGAANASRLLQIDRTKPGTDESTQASYAYYQHLRNTSTQLSGVAAWSKVDLTIARSGAGVSVYGNIVSDNFFSVLGAQPALGRFFLPGEEQPSGGHALVVVSYDFWRTHLGADSAAVGSAITVNGQPFTLIGVAAPEFNGVFTPLRNSAWVTLSMQPTLKPQRTLDGQTNWLWLFARLKDGVSSEQAATELRSLLNVYVQTSVEPEWARKSYTGIRVFALTGLPDDAHKAMAAFLGVLLAASLVVLIIAGVNVAAMLSARAVARRHEMALRAALGAQRSRLVRQLVTETMVLFGMGAAGGMLLAIVATRALERLPLPTDQPLVITLPVDGRVLAFTIVLAVLCGLVFGLVPALRAARRDLQSQLRADSTGGGRRRPIVSNVLVIGQLALSMVLLVSAGLLVRALQRGQQTDAGFNAAGVTVSSFASESWGYSPDKARLFFEQLRTRVENEPGVTNVSYAAQVPVTLSGSGGTITVDAAAGDQVAATTLAGTVSGTVSGTASGSATRAAAGTAAAGTPATSARAPGTQEIGVGINTVAPGYFTLLGIRQLGGRDFDRTDLPTSERVAIINETLARKLAPAGDGTGNDAIGRTFRWNKNIVRVIGVVADAKYQSLNEPARPFIYVPQQQEWWSSPTLLVKSGADAAAMTRLLTRVVRELDAQLPVPTTLTLTSAMSFSLIPQRVAALVAGSLGVVGLLLATVGLYGIVAYSVGQRARELGIRMTLGAQRRDVQNGVVRDGMKLAAIGVVSGLLLSLGASQLLKSYLYGVSPIDALTYAAISALFVAVTYVANYLPARRASLADPMRVLRGD